jgi:hypothetical protein
MPDCAGRMIDALVRDFVADDVFPIVPLPESRAGCITPQVDAFGGHGFERTDQPPQRLASHGGARMAGPCRSGS